MRKHRIRFILIVIAVISTAADFGKLSRAAAAETWHLGKDRTSASSVEPQWKPASADEQSKYLLAVSQTKRLADTGKTKALREAFAKLKKDFPQVAGPDFDAFAEAEILRSRGKLVNAGHSYDKFLTDYPASELYEAVLDRQYSVATAFLAGEKKTVLKIFKVKGYDDGVKMMEKISDRSGNAPIAVDALVSVAQSYEKRQMFEEAYLEWSQISSKWPTGQIGRDALLGMARCKHAAYKGPRYDASNLISAKTYYENFKLRYPEDAQKLDIDAKLKLIDEQMAYKQFSIGLYYQQTGSREPASMYYQTVADGWPESTATKMAKQQIDKSNLKKEKKSIWENETIKKLGKIIL
jgi:outer membrane protein assembly factor BamD (BamD/ComL family)